MAFRVGQPNFSKGEIGPKLRARFDTQAYQSAAAKLLNVVILKEGGLTKRVGTRLVAKAYNQDPTEPVRLVPFVYSIEQAYVLEVGQGYMRPAALGGMVLNDALTITGITQAANAVVSCAYHGYSVGDQVFFSGVEGMVEINGRIATIVAVPSDSSYSIDLDTSSFSAFTGDTGGTTNTAPPDPDPPAVVVPPVVEPVSPPVVGGGGGGGRSNPREVLP